MSVKRIKKLQQKILRDRIRLAKDMAELEIVSSDFSSMNYQEFEDDFINDERLMAEGL